MKPSCIIALFATLIGLASGEKKADDSNQYMIFMPPDFRYYAFRFTKNRFRLQPSEACVAYQSMGWLVESLIEPAKDIPNNLYGKIDVEPHLQSGTMVHIMRVMMLWEIMMKEMSSRFHLAAKWPEGSHMMIAQCYLQYAHQVAEFMKALIELGAEFGQTDLARCLMEEKIYWVRHYYFKSAYPLYYQSIVWDPKIITGFLKNFQMLSSDVPDPVPEWFRTPFPKPDANRTIGDYIAEFDEALPLDSGLMWKALQAWKCEKL